MKRILASLVLLLSSCAGVSNYPINLSYLPSKQYAKTDGKVITVALLNDKRAVADKRAIGTRDNEIAFIALIDGPSVALAKAFKTYLANRGYTVNRLDEVWDGTVQTIKPGWGDLVIGGSLEDFSITARSISLVKTEYICSIKITLVFADVKSKEIKHQERFEVSTSYVTVSFSRDKAEELINSALSDTVERALAGTGKYLSKQ